MLFSSFTLTVKPNRKKKNLFFLFFCFFFFLLLPLVFHLLLTFHTKNFLFADYENIIQKLTRNRKTYKTIFEGMNAKEQTRATERSEENGIASIEFPSFRSKRNVKKILVHREHEDEEIEGESDDRKMKRPKIICTKQKCKRRNKIKKKEKKTFAEKTSTLNGNNTIQTMKTTRQR